MIVAGEHTFVSIGIKGNYNENCVKQKKVNKDLERCSYDISFERVLITKNTLNNYQQKLHGTNIFKLPFYPQINKCKRRNQNIIEKA